MDARKLTKQVRLTRWTEIMRERNESGLTVKQWCRENGIKEKTYYYWQRKLREAVSENIERSQLPEKRYISMPLFKEVKIAQEPQTQSLSNNRLQNSYNPDQLQIEINDIFITAGKTYPPEVLAVLIRELVRP